MSNCESSSDCGAGKICDLSTKQCTAFVHSNIDQPPNWCRDKLCQVKTVDGNDFVSSEQHEDPCRRMNNREACENVWVKVPGYSLFGGKVRETSKECIWNPNFGNGLCETPQDGGRDSHPLCPSTECNYESISPISGCKEDWATNYMAIATENDPSMCELAGCRNERSENYNENATEDDGSCIIVGCTDENALNYDEDATTLSHGGEEAECILSYYDFNNFEFTGCINNNDENKRSGPQLSDCRAVYTSTQPAFNDSRYFYISEDRRGYQLWMVPVDGRYKIEAWGGDGGTNSRTGREPGKGGVGAYVKGEFNLNKGDIYSIVVGMGGDGEIAHTYCGAGGGGATWVVKTPSINIRPYSGGGSDSDKDEWEIENNSIPARLTPDVDPTVEDILIVAGGGGGASGHNDGWGNTVECAAVDGVRGPPDWITEGSRCINSGDPGQGGVEIEDINDTSAAHNSYSSGGGGGFYRNGNGNGYSSPNSGNADHPPSGGGSFLGRSSTGAAAGGDGLLQDAPLKGGTGGYYTAGQETTTADGGGCEGNGGFGGGAGGAAHGSGGGGGVNGGAGGSHTAHARGGNSYISSTKNVGTVTESDPAIKVMPDGVIANTNTDGSGKVKITLLDTLPSNVAVTGGQNVGEESVGFENMNVNGINGINGINGNGTDDTDNSNIMIIGIIVLILLVLLGINCKKK